MKEEYEERQLAKVENAANKAENLVKGIEKPRDWFQTGQKRKKAKGIHFLFHFFFFFFFS